MSGPLDPGPPLVAGEESCPQDPPTRGEFTRAITIAGIATLCGAAAQFLASLATQRVWGFVTVLFGVVIGLLVNWAAGRHRSVSLGIVAAVATLGAALFGYSLLWLPFVTPPVNRSLTWFHLIMLGVGLFIAYLLAGPRTEQRDF